MSDMPKIVDGSVKLDVYLDGVLMHQVTFADRINGIVRHYRQPLRMVRGVKQQVTRYGVVEFKKCSTT